MMKLDLINTYFFAGFCMGKGYDLQVLKNNGDKDVIAVLYTEFEEKLKEFKEK